MKPILCALAAFVVAGGLAGAQQSRDREAGSAIEIDGTACGRVARWEGGDGRAQVAVEAAGADRVSKKQVSGVVYQPIVVEIAAPPARPLIDWINELLSGAPKRRDVVLKYLDPANPAKSEGGLKARLCYLTKVAFPVADGTLRSPAMVVLTLQPESTEAVGPGPSGVGTSSTPVATQNSFAFAFDGGFNTPQVLRVEGLSASLRLPAGGTGEAISGQAVTGVPEVSNFFVSVPENRASDWRDWFQRFAVAGQNGDESEKTGSLAFLAPNAQELFKVKAVNVGILSVVTEASQTAGLGTRRVKSELYAEKLEVVLPTAPGGASGAATPPASNPPAADSPTASNPPAATNPPSAPTPPSATNPPSASNPPAASNPPSASNPPATPGPSATPAAGSPEDQGARDPFDFPRPKETVRKSYSSNRNKIISTEQASYSAKPPIYKLEQIFEALLKESGWEQTGRTETGDPKKNTHTVVLSVKKGARTGQLTISQAKDGSTEYTIVLNEPSDLAGRPRPGGELPPAPSGKAEPYPAPIDPRDRTRELPVKPGAAPPAGVPATAPPGAAPSATAKMTAFDPKVHGFRFTNDYRNNPFGPPIKVVTSGLCGGMSYAAQDYFQARMEIPQQNFRPSHNTQLQTYLYRRQETSLLLNLDNWAEISLNPLGARTVEIFNWGLRERLAELRSLIDRGIPAQVCLKGPNAGFDGDHQVLAVGYDMGRYKGDVGDFKEDLKIFLYEPNYPGELITMVADQAKLEFTYKGYEHKRWRSYFVDTKYTGVAPPLIANPIDQDAIRDGLVHALRCKFTTGEEELLGGPLWLNLTIVFHDGTKQEYPNISQGGRWIPNYQETVQVSLSKPCKFEDIKFLELNTNSTAGPKGNRWDMKFCEIDLLGGGFRRDMPFRDPSPYKFQGLPTQLVPK